MEKGKNIPWWLIVVTVVWIFISFAVIYMTIKSDPTVCKDNSGFFAQIDYTKSNNWGDVLAGFFAPLALLWIGFGVYIQRLEFSNLAQSVEDQTVQADAQINLLASQEVANLYATYSTNMSKLYIRDNIDLEELNNKFNSINVYKDTIDNTETIENILLYNHQVETYFFKNTEHKNMNISDILKIDYDVIHIKEINIAKMLYIKIAILKLVKDKYSSLAINLPANITISRFVNKSLSERIDQLISTTSKKDEIEMATIIFDNITTDENNAIKYIEVKNNG